MTSSIIFGRHHRTVTINKKYHIVGIVTISKKYHTVGTVATDKKYHSDGNINILPLVEGVMVDYRTREKLSHSGKRIYHPRRSRG